MLIRFPMSQVYHGKRYDTLTILLGDRCLFGQYAEGAGHTSGFAFVYEPRIHDPLEGRSERLRQRFADCGGPVPAYLAALAHDEPESIVPPLCGSSHEMRNESTAKTTEQRKRAAEQRQKPRVRGKRPHRVPLEASMSTIAHPCLEVQTSEQPHPAAPCWFAETLLIAQDRRTHRLLDALATPVRLVRGRVGRYESIDLLVLLFGEAISGERP
jgi:hypothetical protein